MKINKDFFQRISIIIIVLLFLAAVFTIMYFSKYLRQ